MFIKRGAAWDFWAPRYEIMVAQPFSLKPTREAVLARVAAACPDARRLLDVGCGVGQLSKALAERMPDLQVTGVDPSALMIRRARADYAHPRVTHVNGFVEDVPADPPFDVVVTTHAFPYVPDPDAFLRAVRDRLRPGGRLFLAQACTESWWDAAFLRIVKLTTGPAVYAAAGDVAARMASAGLRPDGIHAVPALPLIPSLAVIEAVRE
jgi:2-polyprenyl-3-methyl-5-hydroxy-6-metoxy-1,4-benzoquinol methylase